MASFDNLTDSELRKKLKDFGYNAPPITQTTRKVLLKKLSNFVSESRAPRNAAPKTVSPPPRLASRQTLSHFSSGEESASEAEDGARRVNTSTRMPPPKSTVRRKTLTATPTTTTTTTTTMSTAMTPGFLNNPPPKRRNRFTLPSTDDSCSDSEPFQSNFGRKLRMERANSLRGPPLVASSPPPVAAASVADVVKEDDTYRGYINGTYNFQNKMNFSPLLSSTLSDSRLPSLNASTCSTASTSSTFPEEKALSKQQVVSTILQVFVLIFFLVLAVLYTMSIRTREVGSPLDMSKTTIPICKNELNMDGPCIHTENLEPTVSLFHKLHPELMDRALKYRCDDQVKAKDPIMSEKAIVDWLYSLPENTIEQHILTYPQIMIQSLKTLVLSNPQWGVTVVGEGNPLNMVLTGALTIPNPPLPIGCYFKRTIFGLAYSAIIALGLLVSGFIGYQIFRWWMNKREQRRQAVCDLVQRALDVLAAHQQENGGFMSINHVRDQILSPSERHLAAALWDEAVQFIETQESRVRSENQTISGEACVVWRWLPPPRRNKVWQGQAFETQAGAVNSLPVSPTPCLKIRHMFDPDLEAGNEWPLRVQDAVLEKCEGIKIVHLAVDKTNKEGCVYLYCLNEEEAGRAYRTLHGSWFDSKLVTVKYLRLERYLERFPDAAASKDPLHPSNGQRLSLAKH